MSKLVNHARRSKKCSSKQYLIQHGKNTEYVNLANAELSILTNPDFQAATSHAFDGQTFIAECLHVNELDDQIKLWAFELCRSFIQKQYENSSMGWNAELKYEEMTEDCARFILVREEESNKLVAFSHFRFDMDHFEEVVYCYELHVERDYQRKGIGMFILNLLEHLAFVYRMDKVILTVFKCNEDAIHFYRNCGFVVDVTSPKENKVYCDYVILSKYVSESEMD